MQRKPPNITEHILKRGPFATALEAEQAALATLRALGEFLLPDERSWLAAELPHPFNQALASGRGAPEPACEVPEQGEFFARVAFHERVRQGLATEHAEIACQVLAECLPHDSITRLKKHLPTLAGLFELPEIPAAPTPRSHRGDPRAPRDLAEGRPGGTHPLATSDLSSLAHRHSVARADNPHEDTKLSSAPGTRQQSEGRTLASGAPGARRKLSDSH